MTPSAGGTKGRPLVLSPSRWPVRWRLAGVSAVLTFVILLAFAAVVGKLSQERLENDFANQLQAAATRIAFTVEINPQTGGGGVPAELTSGGETVRHAPPFETTV